MGNAPVLAPAHLNRKRHAQLDDRLGCFGHDLPDHGGGGLFLAVRHFKDEFVVHL